MIELPAQKTELPQRFLTFRVASEVYALPAGDVAEVIPMPPVARLPLGPKGLLGMANLRGTVLPIASLRALLGLAEATTVGAARAVVLAGAAPVAVAVDVVEALVSVANDRIKSSAFECTEAIATHLRGVFDTVGAESAKILDLAGLLAAAFVQRARPPLRGAAIHGAPVIIGETADDAQLLVAFEVAGQVYALEMEAVQEILPAPLDTVTSPRAEAVLLGMTAYRGALLPLLSLRGLLGFPAATERVAWREKMVVVSVGGVQVGLVADRMRAILTAARRAIDPLPAVIVARTGGEARIKAVYRGGAGVGLVSILAPDLLFREDVMRRIGEMPQAAQPHETMAPTTQMHVLVFRLGDEEFALPIEAVDQVTRVPDNVTRIPRTPKFLEGVVNLHGEVLPVIDQRRRFDLPKFQGDGLRRRLIVVRSAQHRAGLIVDGVREVLRVAADAVEPAPDLAGEVVRLVHGVINLEASRRMVLLLDPAELLSRSERGLLDSFAAATARTPS